QNMQILYDEKTKLFEQHDGFFDLPHLDIKSIPSSQFPLYSNWSYDRIYRNDMIKQPDVLMFMLMHSSDFSLAELEANFDYYEPRCIHESSLSPSVHSILAATLGREEKAYELFRFAIRMDLDNYNRNTDEGLHTTSIAGGWQNIVYGYGGLRFNSRSLSLSPTLPRQWESYRFSLKYQGRLIRIEVCRDGCSIYLEGEESLNVSVYGEALLVTNKPIFINRPERRSACGE
ncbi:family 65 glycosyl hydrolase, partial [Clostridiaceae bacterium OttesenSCG-928-D20]|nr:family 65 glycosyl hydrolase [Clostridiaceae bacterium OttesenSCG-928-D20]